MEKFNTNKNIELGRELEKEFNRQFDSKPEKLTFHFLITQVSDCFLWINSRAVALTASMFAISMVYMLAFINEEKIPLSISTVTAALPGLFLLLSLLITIIVITLFSPVWYYFSSNLSHNKYLFLQVCTDIGVKKKFSSKFFLIWLFVNSVNIALVYKAVSFIGEGEFIEGLIFFVISPFVSAIILMLTNNNALKTGCGEYFALAFSLIPHALTILFILIIDHEFANDVAIGWSLFPIITTSILLFTLIQTVVVYVIMYLSYSDKNPLSTIVFGLMLLIALLCFVPSLGASITKNVISLINSGSRACVVFSLKSNDIHADLIRPIGNNLTNQTNPLKIVIDADGYLYVRLLEVKDKDLYFIPRSAISAINDCKKK